jgi:ATPase family AAA domain-containing protein 2
MSVSTVVVYFHPLSLSQFFFSDINSLKEMTLLPLLYPEVFQRFNVTPPRGVLFHGPPGTGKTLLARALAASARSNGKNISTCIVISCLYDSLTLSPKAFFMRKGADCLSKWVGEAERQLRLLFEEAKNCQPSIIFFDEIDGLAPVRSSKQDQVHASIVSTLLALMDGMDGRGQVIVIGATNRPDAIDPALRRPGRFDREFYFPLPNLAARERIIRIMTKHWQGWEGEQGEENSKGLGKMTKGYGGADLRVRALDCSSCSLYNIDPAWAGIVYGGRPECGSAPLSADLQVARQIATQTRDDQCRTPRLYDCHQA